jgi:hypothetical protein
MTVADTRSSVVPYFVWPSTVKAAAADVLSSLEGTNDTVNACTTLDAPTKASWLSFYTPTKAFLTTEISPSVWGLGGQMDNVNSAAQDLFGWQTLLSSRSCTLTVPSVDPSTIGPTITPLVKIIQWGVVGIVAVTGAYGIGKALEFVPRPSGRPSRPSGSSRLQARRIARRLAE